MGKVLKFPDEISRLEELVVELSHNRGEIIAHAEYLSGAMLIIKYQYFNFEDVIDAATTDTGKAVARSAQERLGRLMQEIEELLASKAALIIWPKKPPANGP